MDPKNIFASKTFWFNTLLVLGEVLQLILAHRVLSPEATALVGGIGNIVLRRLTNQPVAISTTLTKPAG